MLDSAFHRTHHRIRGEKKKAKHINLFSSLLNHDFIVVLELQLPFHPKDINMCHVLCQGFWAKVTWCNVVALEEFSYKFGNQRALSCLQNIFMEVSTSHLVRKQSQQTPMRKLSSSGSQKDLCFVTRDGSLSEVDSALALLKKNGGNINSRNAFGLTPLHIATWRNHIPIVRRLIAAGADPDARDGESGWSSLHRALHFGHLVAASVLLQSGASLTLEDSKCRTPVDLLSGPVVQAVGNVHKAAVTEVFSWGSGANYQLGTGNAHIQKLPCKVDSLQGSSVKLVSAAKFHSVAVGTRGEVYTWGFGRGGRLGHPDFDIHSGQAAVITPRQVTFGVGSCRVKAIAAAKHHTIIATEGGEVFTWGSNREGQLGYTSVDTQPTPRRVSSLKPRVSAVAAANKHTAVVTDSGEVFTWGCNKEGQLGYGTSNSASNYIPRVVESVKFKRMTGVSTSKYHTIVLGDGEVHIWGHRQVNPRKVDIAKCRNSGPVKFHHSGRPKVVAIAAGMVHSMALTADGSVFYWNSAHPEGCQQLYSLSEKNVVSISAGKYWAAVVTDTGDVYKWDGKKSKDEPPVMTRLHGVKRVTSVSVGETHMLLVCALYHPSCHPQLTEKPQEPMLEVIDESEELDEHFMFSDLEKVENRKMSSTVQKDDPDDRGAPSLKSLCEKVAVQTIVEAKNAIQLLEIAEALGADELRNHCEEMVIRNLDYIFTVSTQAIANASPDILVNLEKLLDSRSSEPWSYRRLPTPTATFPVIINSEEEDECEYLRVRANPLKPVSKNQVYQGSVYFRQNKDGADPAVLKAVRNLRKKLQQIEVLEIKQSNGHLLDEQQIAKLQAKPFLEGSLAELGVLVETQENASSPMLLDGKGKKIDVPRKQRRKSKQKLAQVEAASGSTGTGIEPVSVKGFSSVEIFQTPNHKEDTNSEEADGSQLGEESPLYSLKKENPDSRDGKNQLPATSKKKKKKGGLSMFLSGGLDDDPKRAAPPPPTPKSEGPVWGGAKISKGSASLREIQNEQSTTKGSRPSRVVKDLGEDFVDGSSSGQIRLGLFMPVGTVSSPIPVGSAHPSPMSDGEKSMPSWAAAGTSPIFSRPSLRDIQLQQEKNHHAISHSPKTKTAGFTLSSSQGSPSDTNPSRWFKPEVDIASSIRSIQIEEKAMKDLKRFYSSVKVASFLTRCFPGKEIKECRTEHHSVLSILKGYRVVGFPLSLAVVPREL
ncbi:hypothetical protein NE237_003735 [Protea cynaroides]|uniref:Inhibitor of Bruton tyrosine kinase n=1 Tax=Protea cynaroides TaxID=273540 RepID=A0A9Q0KHY1_9MAGN|nr:hypothetical protein NE237_003735 [Protea cynaroides]